MAFAPRAQGAPGVEIRAVPADSAGQAAGIQVGDVLVAMDGTAIAQIPQLLTALKQHRAGDEVTLKLERAGAALEKKLKLTALPRESSSEFDVIYDSFAVGKARLSAIVTKPKGAGPFPSVIFLPGLACISYDVPNGDLFGIKGMLYEMTRSGYVTMRPEKSGMGDSEGPACEDTDFLTEAAGFEQALRTLEAYDFVDKNNVFIMGHSMGGVMAPVVASRVGGVRGALVYGTTGRTWVEYMIENSRRDSLVGGTDPVQVEQEMRVAEAFLFEAYINHRSGRELRAMNPKFAEMIDADDRYSGRKNVFFQQLQDTDLAKLWSQFSGDVLAVWGKCDFVTGPADHEAIAQAVNHAHPGHGEFRTLEGIDHFFGHSDSLEDSFKQFSQRSFKPFNPIIQETLRAWLNQQTHKPN